jgi:hypothetical protein
LTNAETQEWNYFQNDEVNQLWQPNKPIRCQRNCTVQGTGLMTYPATKANFLTFALLACVACSALYGAQESSQSPFPYRATVAANEVAIHSGPGSVHYVSTKLELGKTVEVYRHDPGGWCAIRPPGGSFSLVPATVVEELGDGIGEITEDGTQAWVGTDLGPVEKPLWQVKLKMGERVQLLGIATWPDPKGFTTSWYQIEPPAGEFRWIKMDDLKIPKHVQQWQLATREVQSNSKADGENSNRQSNVLATVVEPEIVPAIAQAAFDAESAAPQPVQQASYVSQDRIQPNRGFSQNSQTKPTNSGWRKARFPIERSDSNSGVFASGSIGRDGIAGDSVARDPIAIAPAELNRFNSPPERFASADMDSRYDFSASGRPWSASGGYGSNTSISGAPLTNRMTELELKLNQEMIKEPNLWRLIDLQAAAEQVTATSSDRLEQEQAQRFLAKLENCRYLRDRYIRDGSPGQNPSYQVNAADRSGLNGLDGVNNKSGASTDFSLNSMYDAHGWLKELVRDGGRAEPTYVLQNESGKVTHHVQPGPGMSLSSYVSKRIGIIGQRGYHTRLKLDHVTVQKIIVLN